MDEKVTQCECRQPGWCARHRCEKAPFYFEMCRRHRGFFNCWEAGNGPGQGIDSARPVYVRCRHRGEESIDFVECDLCGGQTLFVPVFACAVFSECTLRRYGTRTPRAREMAACVPCVHFEPFDREASAPLPDVN